MAQPASDDFGIAQQEDVVVDEIGAELLSTVAGGFIELHNNTGVNVDISGWELFACTSGDAFSIPIPGNTVLAPGEFYLVSDINYNAPLGPSPNLTFVGVLEQSGGGMQLLDDAFPPNVKGEVKWGTPQSDCNDFPDAAVSPDDSNAIHSNTAPPPPWCKLPPAGGQTKSC